MVRLARAGKADEARHPVKPRSRPISDQVRQKMVRKWWERVVRKWCEKEWSENSQNKESGNSTELLLENGPRSENNPKKGSENGLKQRSAGPNILPLPASRL